MERIKPIIGAILIIAAIASMVFWEKSGRKLLLSEEVLVAARDIAAGDELKSEDFKIVSLERSAVIAGAYGAGELKKLDGFLARGFFAAGQQIKKNHLQNVDEYMDGRSLFPLKSEWIYSRSSSLRRGDIVKIVSAYSKEDFGEFEVAFVKDVNEQEIVDTSGDGELTAVETPDIRGRKNPSGIPDHVEIFASLGDYSRIIDSVGDGAMLILMQTA